MRSTSPKARKERHQFRASSASYVDACVLQERFIIDGEQGGNIAFFISMGVIVAMLAFLSSVLSSSTNIYVVSGMHKSRPRFEGC